MERSKRASIRCGSTAEPVPRSNSSRATTTLDFVPAATGSAAANGSFAPPTHRNAAPLRDCLRKSLRLLLCAVLILYSPLNPGASGVSPLGNQSMDQTVWRLRATRSKQGAVLE